MGWAVRGAIGYTSSRCWWASGVFGRCALSRRKCDGLSVQKPSSSDRKSTRLNSSHGYISYAVFCLKKKIEDDCFRTGFYPLELPDGLGADAVSGVEAVGPGVTDIRGCDRLGYLVWPSGPYSRARVM